MTPLSGVFITFEGIDGSGKSTQVRLLGDRLAQSGADVVLTREPGGSDGAESIRRLLVEGDPARWSAVTELLLFTAARRDHLERLIRPSLDRGAVVISDRFADSTRVYQGSADPDLRRETDRLHSHYIGLEPDLTLILDMDPAQSLARGLARQSGEDRFEAKGLVFQERLRDGFRALAAEFPERCALLDADRPAPEIAEQILDLVTARFGATV